MTGRPAVLALLLAGAVASAAEPPPLGRVFFAPAERSALDAARDGTAVAPATPGTGTVTVDGVIHRSTGADVVWVNGSAAAGVRRVPAGRAAVVVETAGRRVRLKPGQAFDPATGRVRDCVGCRRPATPAADPATREAADPGPAAGLTGDDVADAAAEAPAATPASAGPAAVAAGLP
jgi:hypothetical protein